jgi:hypothetical protein
MTKTIKLNRNNIDLSKIAHFDNKKSKNGNLDDIDEFDEIFGDEKLQNEDILLNDFDKERPREQSITEMATTFDNNYAPPSIVKYDPINALSKEELTERRGLIIKINRYMKAFPKETDEWKMIDLKTLPMSTLENTLEDIKLTVSTNNTTDMGYVAYTGILNTVENFGGSLNLNLKGLSDIANQSIAIKNCVKECTIEYTSTKYVKPHMRLALLTLGLCYQVDGMNRQKEVINNFLKNEIKDEKVDEYKDL